MLFYSCAHTHSWYLLAYTLARNMAQAGDHSPVFDVLSMVEVPGGDPVGDSLVPASFADRPVNALSTASVDEVVRHLKRGIAPALRPITVSTGGADDVHAFASCFAAGSGASAGNAQFTLSKTSAAYEQYKRAAGLSPGWSGQLKLNVAHLMWRHRHRCRSGECRLLPHGMEVSHLAEGYHKANGGIPGWKPGFKVPPIPLTFVAS